MKKAAENTESKTRQSDYLEKLTWASQELAVAAIAYAGWQYGDGKAQLRPYHCQYCGKWHLARG